MIKNNSKTLSILNWIFKNQVLKYINTTKFNKCSSGDIPAKIIKIAKEEVITAITNCINKCVSSSTFSDKLEVAEIALAQKNNKKMRKLIIEQLVFYLSFQNS